MQTALYGKIKERREAGGKWWIDENTQTLPFNCSNRTQDKTKVRKALIDESQRA